MLPNPYPHRTQLHNEVHARPPETVGAPSAFSHLVMLADAAARQASREHLASLLRERHLPLPDAQANHLRLDVGSFRLRWEMHTEFVTWTFSRSFDAAGFGEREPATALDAVPRDWLAALPGQTLAALHLWVLPEGAIAPDQVASRVLQEDLHVGSALGNGGQVHTDFAMHPDGFARFVVLAGHLRVRQLGRIVQQLLEVETYRMAALLGLPAARMAAAALATAESDLAELAGAIREAAAREEPQLLDRLTKLAGEVESQYAATHSRFSASGAYFELVDRRVADIGESPLPGLQTIGEFIDRRLSPARATCAWATRRQDALSQRVSRISNLLRTRVEIEQQQSSQQLLEAMNRRQGLQLKLQATVEGLSVAAITYYIVGLVSHLAEGAHAIGWPWSHEATAAAAIPVVALGVWLSIRRLHRKVLQD